MLAGLGARAQSVPLSFDQAMPACSNTAVSVSTDAGAAYYNWTVNGTVTATTTAPTYNLGTATDGTTVQVGAATLTEGISVTALDNTTNGTASLVPSGNALSTTSWVAHGIRTLSTALKLTNLKISLRQGDAASGTVRLSVYAANSSGLPTGTALYSTTQAVSGLLPSSSVYANIPLNYVLQPSSDYALVMSTTGFAANWTVPSGFPAFSNTSYLQYTGGRRTTNSGTDWISSSTPNTMLLTATKLTASVSNSATLTVTRLQATSSTTDQSVCANILPIYWNGQTINASGTYTYTTTNSVGCDSTASLNLTVQRAQTPTATIYASANSVCSGQAVMLEAVDGMVRSALSIPPGYQWFRNNQPISGATDYSYTVNAPVDGDQYYVRYAPNAQGACLAANYANSNTITLSVTQCLSATLNYNGGTVCAGAGITVPFTAAGFTGDNTFSVQLSDATGSFANPTLVGTLAATASGNIAVTIPANTPAGTGYRLRLVGSNPAFTSADNGQNMTVQPSLATAIAYNGSPYCAASGTVPVFFSGLNGGIFTAVPAGLSLDAATGAINLSASQAGQYTVTYTVAGSCTTPATALVAVRPTASLLQVPANGDVCPGTVVPANLLAVAGLTYSWTNNNTAIGLPASGMGLVPAFTAANGGNTTISGGIRVYAFGGTGCSFGPTGYAIRVKPTPVLAAVTGQRLCAGSATQAIVFASSVAATTVSWTNDNTSIGLTAQGGGDIPSFQSVNNTAQVQTALISATPYAQGCGGASIGFGIQVAPSVSSISYPQASYCQSGWAYALRNGSAGGTWSATPAGLSLDAVTGAVNLALSTPATYTVTYSVAALGGCAGTASTQLTVQPQASANALPNQVYCNNTVTAPIVFTGTAASYSWSNDNTAVGLAASGSGTSLPSFTTVNAGPGARYAYIKVTPQASGSSCVGKPISFRITVNYCGPVAQSGGTSGNGQTLRVQLALSPNPVPGDVLRLAYTGNSKRLTVEIRDANGMPLLKGLQLSGNNATLNVGMLRAGAYHLVVADPATGAQTTLPFVKL